MEGRHSALSLAHDGIRVDVRKLALQDAGGVLQLLSLLPGLSVSGSAVTVVGRGTPLIYVNGRRISDLSQLSRYDSKDIFSVHIIRNPGVKYGTEVDAVLEIKVRNPEDGLGGRVMLEGSMRERLGHGELLSLVYRRGKVDIFGTATYSYTPRLPKSDIRMTLPDASATALEISADQNDRKRFYSIDVGANYTLSDQQSFGAEYYFDRVPSWLIDSEIATAIRQRDAEERTEQQTTHYRDGNLYHNLNLYYQGQITPRFALRYDMNYVNVSDHATNDFTVTEEDGPRNYHSDLHQSSCLLSGRLQNQLTLGSAMVTVGADAALTHNRQSNEATLETIRQSHSRIRNQLNGAFVSYSQGLQSLMWELGLRYEYNRYVYYEDEMLQEGQSKSYHYVTPTLQLMYQGPVSVSLSYRSQLLRPSYHQLSDRYQYNNRYLYEGGNKYLLPKRVHTASLGLMWRDLMIGADYTYTRDEITFNTSYRPELGAALSMPVNIPSTHRLSLMGQWSPTYGIYRPTLQVMCQKPFVVYEGERFDKPSCSVMLKNHFSLPKRHLSFGINGTYFSGGSQGLSDIDPFCQIDLYAYRTLLDGSLRLSLDVKDLLNSYHPVSHGHFRGLSFSMGSLTRERTISLSVTYYLDRKSHRYHGKSSSSEIDRL